MASLQIRDLPADVYESLSFRAERAGRSLAQQAVAELRKMAELEARERRLETLESIRQRLNEHGEQPITSLSPAELIREDRDR